MLSGFNVKDKNTFDQKSVFPAYESVLFDHFT